MITFAKAQAAASIASVVDYLITVFSTEIFGWWYVVASAVGTLVGGIVNFSLGRRWVFQRKNDSRRWQAVRYLIVWVGYFCLATAGVYLVTHYTGINYLYSKLAVPLFLAFTYNYPLQKNFVFR